MLVELQICLVGQEPLTTAGAAADYAFLTVWAEERSICLGILALTPDTALEDFGLHWNRNVN